MTSIVYRTEVSMANAARFVPVEVSAPCGIDAASRALSKKGFLGPLFLDGVEGQILVYKTEPQTGGRRHIVRVHCPDYAS